LNTFYYSNITDNFNLDNTIWNLDSRKSILVNVHFKGSPIDSIISDTILIHDTICGTIHKVILSTRIGIASAQIQVNNGEAYPGDVISIPIILKNPKNIIYSGASGFTSDVSFNSSLLFPLNTSIGTEQNGIRTIPLDLPAMSAENDTLINIKFKVALGNDSTTPLKLENTISTGGKVALTPIDGTFNLLGICQDGGARLVQTSVVKEGIISISPNPEND